MNGLSLFVVGHVSVQQQLPAGRSGDSTDTGAAKHSIALDERAGSPSRYRQASRFTLRAPIRVKQRVLPSQLSSTTKNVDSSKPPERRTLPSAITVAAASAAVE